MSDEEQVCAACGAGEWNGWDDCPEHIRLAGREQTSRGKSEALNARSVAAAQRGREPRCHAVSVRQERCDLPPDHDGAHMHFGTNGTSAWGWPR